MAYNFAIAVLSAIALNRLLYNRDVISIKSLTVASATVTACSALLAILIKMLIVDPLSRHLLTQKAIDTIARVVSLSNYNLVETFLSYSLFVVWLFVTYKTSRCSPQKSLARRATLIISYCLIPVLVIWNGYYLDRFRPDNPKILDVNHLFQNPIFEYIKENTFWDRSVFIVPHSNLYNIPAEVHTLNGYDPLITSTFAELLYMKHWSTSSNWAGLLQNNLILSTLNARYVVVPQQDVQKYRLEEIKTAVGVPTCRNIPLRRWDLINSKELGEGEFFLVSPDGCAVSMLHQRLSLRPNTFYLLSLEARSAGKELTAALSFDLYGGPNYDFPEQELDVNAHEVKQVYRTFYRIINTGGHIPPQVELRVFTFSKEPIVVRNVEVKELSNFAPPYIASQDPGGKEGIPVYQKVFENDSWVVYENKNCLPRAFTVSNLKVAGDIEDVRRRFELFEFNPAETALVNSEDISRIGRTYFAKGVATIEKYDTDHIVIDVESPDGPSFLVLSDQYFPGWKAYVDGKETPIYCANGLLRGVVVPQGKHVVEFNYRPVKVYAAGIIGLLTLTGVIVFIIRTSKRKER